MTRRHVRFRAASKSRTYLSPQRSSETSRGHLSPVRRRWKRWGARLFQRAMKDNLEQVRAAVEGASSGQGVRLLDLGCWDGSVTRVYAASPSQVFGVELAHQAAHRAQVHNVSAVCADLNRSLPWRSGAFDVVTSNQVIEHLHDTDTFLMEIHRVLRPGGLLVLSTENLSSWHNIFALLLGWQAFSLTNVSQVAFGIGNPLANLRDAEPLDRGWEHLRIFSYRGLQELLIAHGFASVRIVGAGYFPLPASVGHLDPRHAALITAAARRPDH